MQHTPAEGERVQVKGWDGEVVRGDFCCRDKTQDAWRGKLLVHITCQLRGDGQLDWGSRLMCWEEGLVWFCYRKKLMMVLGNTGSEVMNGSAWFVIQCMPPEWVLEVRVGLIVSQVLWCSKRCFCIRSSSTWGHEWSASFVTPREGLAEVREEALVWFCSRRKLMMVWAKLCLWGEEGECLICHAPHAS